MPQIQLRRNTKAEWTSSNPILAAGEVGSEIDLGSTGVKLKVGDGVRSWVDLPYFVNEGDLDERYVPTDDPRLDQIGGVQVAGDIGGTSAAPEVFRTVQPGIRIARVFRGNGAPPASIAGAVTGDIYEDRSTNPATIYDIAVS